MKDIISINYKLLFENVNNLNVNEKHSLSDADIVIISPETYKFKKYPTRNGLTSLSLEKSREFLENNSYWIKELNLFLTNGKNVFIFLNEFEQLRIEQSYDNFKSANNYNFLPIELEIHNTKGKKIISKNSIINTFINDFNDFDYITHINPKSNEFEPLILNRTQDKIISGLIKHSNGNIILLPFIEPIVEEHIDNNNLTEEGLIYQKKILKNIIEIDKIISNKIEKSPRPIWLEDVSYKLKKVEEFEEKITANLSKIKKIEEQNKILQEKKNNEEIFLDLLFETGKPLEQAVIRALKFLGYEAENFDNGILELDQVITSPEGDRYIGECEGKDSKSIDITKFRQLQDSLNEDFQRDEVDEKAFGLLFGNPFRLSSLEERDDFFTKKCLNGADREKIGLIKTVDLFFICRYLSEHENISFKKKCRESIYNGLGSVIEFPKIPNK